MTEPATDALPVPAAPATAMEVAEMLGRMASGSDASSSSAGRRSTVDSTDIAPAASASPAM